MKITRPIILLMCMVLMLGCSQNTNENKALPPKKIKTIVKICPQFQDGISNDIQISDVLVVETKKQPSSLYLQDLKTGLTKGFPVPKSEHLDLFGFSPNRLLVSFSKEAKGQSGEAAKFVQVVDNTGQIINSIPWQEDKWDTYQWLDDQHLLFGKYYRKSDSNVFDNERLPLVAVTSINIFTHKIQDLRTDYSDIYYTQDWPLLPYHLYDWSGLITIIDPMLERVIYPKTMSGNLGSLVLKDMETNHELAVISPPFSKPVWSPDGKYFVLVKNVKADSTKQNIFELVGVSRDGEVSQLTDLHSLFDYNFSFRLVEFSPDGRYISFWIDQGREYSPKETNAHLMILDTVRKEIFDTCVESFASPQPPNLGWSTLWTSDDRQLMVKVIDINHQKQYLLVDLADKYIANIDVKSNETVLGLWRTEIP